MQVLAFILSRSCRNTNLRTFMQERDMAKPEINRKRHIFLCADR
jgi:hypothetical protein